jgi:RNA polymerase sigma-70 factor, ECF subfamily
LTESTQNNPSGISQREFEKLFKTHFTLLYSFAVKIIKDKDAAREISHKVFVKLWEKREEIDFSKPLRSYLFTAVHNRCLNHLRDQKKFIDKEVTDEWLEHYAGIDEHDKLVSAESIGSIMQAIEALPEKCREVFKLSRFEELSYYDIAGKLNLSVKTVESHMSKALALLRESLADFLSITLVLLFNLFQK